MAKNLKLNVKNAQLAQAINLGKFKKKEEAEPQKAPKTKKKKAEAAAEIKTSEEPKKIKVRVIEEVVEVPPEPIIVEEKPLPPPTPPVDEKKKKKEVELPVVEEILPPPVEKKEVPPVTPQPPIVIVPKAAPPPSQPPRTPFVKKPIIEEKKEISTAKKEVAFPKSMKKERTGAEEGEAAPKTALKDLKGIKKGQEARFDSRDRLGLRAQEEERWRKKRAFHKFKKHTEEIAIVRPTELKVKLPITIKDLASEMKLKSSEIISKFFAQGIVLTLNDALADETLIQLVGHEFGCNIAIDKSEEERLRITSKSIKEEIEKSATEHLEIRPPVVAFMGHVDHGKTSLIDAIRQSNLAASEAGAITQHIGAFSAQTAFGPITILDTPGHEAFSEMRSRGAIVTDIIVLVIAGDEGILEQTEEAIRQAKEAKVPIVVAINKSDKAGFDPEKVYRQLADHELLPEVWGGTIITVNCSAVTKKGIKELLEMLSLQSEVLELKANPASRARGTVLESEMHKGLGATATVLVQNGTLKLGDAIVLGHQWGRVKTMHDQYNTAIAKATPSTPIKITGISDIAEAGCEFIVVPNEKEAKELAEARAEEVIKRKIQQPKKAAELFLQEKKESQAKKILPIILRADVQGSLEALKNSLMKIKSEKALINIVSAEVGEISESDVQLAAASKAPIIGFHTRVENHAEGLIKEQKVTIHLHDIIYHAVDDVKVLMVQLLDKLEQENVVGSAIVKAVFKSSQFGAIAGCSIVDGLIKRNNFIKVIRNGEIIWKGKIASLKRVKEDVKEVQKGLECGILLEKFSDFQEGDKLEAYEITYLEQTL